jgi:hypothetical protein
MIEVAFKFQQPVSGFFFLSSTLSTMSARRGKQASVAESSGDQNLEEQDEYRDIPSDDEDRQEDAESDGYSGSLWDLPGWIVSLICRHRRACSEAA